MTAINNFIIHGYNFLRPSVRWQYIGILAQADTNGEIPSSDVIPCTQHKLFNALQIPKSTFIEYLHVLKEAKLIEINSNRKICLLEPDPNILEDVRNFKISLLKSKNNKYIQKSNSIGFTLVPNSLLYGYPELLPAAKYVYVLIKSLDWTNLGATWHQLRKLAQIAGIKYRTFRKYLRDLQKVNLICLTKKFGVYKKTVAVFYNSPSVKEQNRARQFIGLLKSTIKSFNRLQFNTIFDSFESNKCLSPL